MDQKKTEDGYTIFISNKEIEKGKKIVVYTGLALVGIRIVRFLVWR